MLRLIQQACLALLLIVCQTARIEELNEDNLPKDILAKYEFSILNFYDSSPEGQEFIEIFERAQKIYFQRQPEAEYGNKIVWAQLDYPSQPKLHFSEETIAIPNQFIFGLGIMRQLRFKRHTTNMALEDGSDFGQEETIEEAAVRFAELVIDLTRDYFTEISCDEIEEMIQYDQPIFVYFGPIASLYGQGDMSHLARVVLKDRFSFSESQEIKFFVNDNADCKERRQFDPDEPAVALYVHPEVAPFILQPPHDSLDYAFVSVWLSTSMMEFSALWSQRASELIFENRVSALIYLMPDDFKSRESDWVANKLMPGVQDFLRERSTGIIPIVSPLTNDPENIKEQRGNLDNLKDIFEVNADDLPWIFLLHGNTGSVIPYPYELSSQYDASPQTIALWARRVIITLEIPQLTESLEEAIEEKDEKAIKYFESLKNAAEEELVIVIDKFEEFHNILKQQESEREDESEQALTDEL